MREREIGTTGGTERERDWFLARSDAARVGERFTGGGRGADRVHGARGEIINVRPYLSPRGTGHPPPPPSPFRRLPLSTVLYRYA